MESMASKSSPDDLGIIERFESDVGLSSACKHVSLVESIEPPLLRFVEDEIRQLGNLFRGLKEGKYFSDSGNDFGLLRLIIKDGNLFSFVVLELFSQEGVFSANSNYF
jgi:hypothetical protein